MPICLTMACPAREIREIEMSTMKFSRRSFHAALIGASLLMVGLPQPASAGGPVPFSAEAFKAAQAAGSPILVEIHAD
jgi:thioredoxin 1